MEKLGENLHVHQTRKSVTLKKNYTLEACVQNKTIFIRLGNAVCPIELNQIIYCHSVEPFVCFIFYSANQELIEIARSNHLSVSISVHGCGEKPAGFECLIWRKRLTLSDMATAFAKLNFCRVHKRYLVNMLQIKKIVSSKSTTSEIIMSNQDVLPVSTQGKNYLLERIGKF